MPAQPSNGFLTTQPSPCLAQGFISTAHFLIILYYLKEKDILFIDAKNL